MPPPTPGGWHAIAAGAVLRLDTLKLVRGSLPRRALSLVLEWAMAHRAELRQNWERAERGEPIVTIEPLE